MLNQATTYDNAFYPDNVYGHALELLKKHRPVPTNRAEISIHLDIGCGYGRIAEPLQKELGLKYVGVDADTAALANLSARGLENHKVDLSSTDHLLQVLRDISNGRSIASITMLDTLEHLGDGDAVLRCLSELAKEHRAFLVLSVPNVTHRDVGLKLAFGRFDYTSDGLLDYTHTRFFSETSFKQTLEHCGLYCIEKNDVRVAISDQHFPDTHPALSRGTSLNRLLTSLRHEAEENDDVNQFVWACVAGPLMQGEAFIAERQIKRPFLSIVTRTQGKRMHSLIEVFTCLAGQTCTDFEVLVVGHRLTEDARLAVERVIEDNPEWLRNKIRLVRVDKGNRTHPLNRGFEEARGQYIAILDDDDTPMAHWVETFQSLAKDHPGRLLRASVVRQDVVTVNVLDKSGVRATGSMEQMYPAEFDFVDHLRGNHTPPISVAFPRGVFHDLNIRFDEDLSTTEDWDYMMRVASIADTASSPAITSIYHWWVSDQSSRTDHPTHEWATNHQRIFQKMDEGMLLFPKGTSYRIRQLLDDNDQLKGKIATQEQMRSELRATELSHVVCENDRLQRQLTDQAMRHELIETLRSTSWRITAPLRFVGRLKGGAPITVRGCMEMSGDQLHEALSRVRSSRSWKVTSPMRRLKGMA
ncbi:MULTISPECIES: methyltransferase domain-containing protein [Burkholderia]|uniref:Glycosyl transferase family 2 n=1 Tax=Burkholderia pyrrocinia TaxID=60550 RepID=A0A318IY62_BURPY|nr:MULTISPECIES: methyltransferase domain-containing protein [Burkholderia]PXX39321.1 glycosyl transferase family 2 [Burkholderia pyrrocinia]SFW19159.1 Glycosyl transferase family 2 [Burkholderia sp. NFACC33-1]SFX15672.1 Glycosyl transferase family 2 [Burkholderia sp. NFPP32]